MAYLPMPALGQAAMAGSLPVTIASDQSAVPVSGTFWQATQPVSIATMPTTPTKPDGTIWAMTGTSANVNLTNASVAVTGTFWQATQPVSSTQLPAALGQTTMAASLPVSIASNQSAIPVTGTFWQTTQPVSIAATVNVAQTLGTAATRWFAQISDGTNSPAVKAASTAAAAADPSLTVALSPNSPAPVTALSVQACTPKVLNAAGAATSVKASAGNVYGFSLINNNAAAVYVEFFDAASVTLGTTTPLAVFIIPASGTLTVPPSDTGLFNCATQIQVAAVTAYNGSSTGSVTGTIFYK